MDNINGINVDISAVLSEQLAKIAVSKISEEQIHDICNRALIEATDRPYRYGGKDSSKVDNIATKLFYDKVSEEIEEILQDDEYKKKAREEAELILKEMKEKLHEKLINNITDKLCMNYTDVYGCSFKTNVANIVNEMMMR